MAVARDQTTSSFYGSFLESGAPAQFLNMICPNYGFDDYNQNPDGNGLDENPNKMIGNNNQLMMSHSSPISSSSSGNSSNNGFLVNPHDNYQTHVNELSFKPRFLSAFMNSGGSNLLSFQQVDQDQTENNTTTNYHKLSHSSSSFSDFLDEVNCLQAASCDGSGGYEDAAANSDQWLYAEASIADQPGKTRVSGAQDTCFPKRPHLEEEINKQATKKQCSASSSKKPAKPKSSTTPRDPQSIAAKNRRERISERLKILQDLVPNGSKVDLVTMLEKAIGYVKFLQLQVKVLATDEFWPAASGKAPDISQVKEAIDAILSSQRSERGSNSPS